MKTFANKVYPAMVLLAATGMLAACATQTPNLAYERQLDARLQTAEALGIDPDVVVCRSTDVSGSRIKKVVCGSRDEIAKTMQANQDAFRSIVNSRQAQAGQLF